MSGAPSVERELGLSHAGYVTYAFALPLVVAALLEAGIALASDGRDRRHLIVYGQAALSASLFFTGWTSRPWGLAVGLAFAGAASGVACGAAQALLIASSARSTDRAMARWSLCCAVGDVLTPLLTSAAIALGRSYRGAMTGVALVVLAQCLTSAALASKGSKRGRASEAAPPSEPPAEPLGAAIGRAFRLPRLWAWLFAAATCTLLDELVIALAALRLTHDRNAGDAFAACVAVAFSGGALFGAALSDRALARFSSQRVLVASALLCASALGGLVFFADPIASAFALFVVGAASAPHHPLAFARAYDALPDRPGTVQAMGQLFVVVDVGAPLALGLVADRFGLGAALGCLLLQPAVILGCTMLVRSAGGSRVHAKTGP